MNADFIFIDLICVHPRPSAAKNSNFLIVMPFLGGRDRQKIAGDSFGVSLQKLGESFLLV